MGKCKGIEKLCGFGTQEIPPGGSISQENFCERMGRALSGLCVGVVLFFLAIYLSGWNEGRAVHTMCAIFEAENNFQEAPCEMSSDLDGQLVHVACDIDQKASMKMYTFDELSVMANGTAFQGSLQQYQIVENKACSSRTTAGGGKETVCEYSYAHNWSPFPAHDFQSPDPASSPSYFGINPSFPNIDVPSMMDDIVPVHLGEGYILSQSMSRAALGAPNSVGPSTPLSTFTDENTWNAKSGTGTAPSTINADDSGSNFRYAGGEFVTYPGSQPRVGDLKIDFTVFAPVAGFSVLAKQMSTSASGSFEKYHFEKCNNYGVYYSSQGKKTSTELFETAENTNKAMTWGLRFAGFFGLWCGLQLCFGPCMLMPDLIPCIGPYIGNLVGCMLCCATCLLATSISLTVIAISWIYFRPMIAIPMLVVAVLSAIGLIVWRCMEKKKGVAYAAV